VQRYGLGEKEEGSRLFRFAKNFAKQTQVTLLGLGGGAGQGIRRRGGPGMNTLKLRQRRKKKGGKRES